MNKIKLTSAQCAALEDVKQNFATWRKTKSGRAPIPASLWSAAVHLFHSFGLSVNIIARSLRLNHATLKIRISENSPVAINPVENDSATFIEIEPPQVCSDCVIEMENQSGVKMRMCFTGRVDPAAIDLGRYFIEGHP